MYESAKSLWRRFKPRKADASLVDLHPKGISINPERAGICFVTMLKDEAPYVAEWIAFHAVQGVDRFIIYDNASSDDLRAAIAGSGFKDRVTVVPWHSFHLRIQILAHNHALATFGGNYRWVGFFDVDEFLVVKGERAIGDALKAFEAQPLLSLPWHMYGTSGNRAAPKGLVIDNYTTRAPLAVGEGRTSRLLNWKCLVDPARIRAMKVHEADVMDQGVILINELGQRFEPRIKRERQFAVSDVFQLNHYYTRSMEEFESKIAKGAASSAATKINETHRRGLFALIHEQSLEDPIASKFSQRVRKVMDEASLKNNESLG